MTLRNLRPPTLLTQKESKIQITRVRSSKHGLEGIPCFMPFAMRLVAEAALLYDTPSSRTVGCLECRLRTPNAGSTFGSVYGGRKLGPALLRNPVGYRPDNFTVRAADGPFFRAEYFPLSALHFTGCSRKSKPVLCLQQSELGIQSKTTTTNNRSQKSQKPFARQQEEDRR